MPVRPTSPAGAALADLARLIGAATPSAHPTVTGVTLRAAEVRPGDLFAGVAGSRAHGAGFLDQAVAAGAVALLTDPAGAAMAGPDAGIPVLVMADPRAVLGAVAAEVYGRPSEHLAVIGVTGTAGKTTTCYLLEAGLAAAGLRTGLIGTVQTRIADRVLPSAFTTPEAPDLQALFAVMVRRACRRWPWRSPRTPWPWAGSAAPGSRSVRSPICPRTTWISTTTWRATSGPRPCCSTAGRPPG